MGVDAILARMRAQASARAIRITDHAREEMEAESVTLAEVLEVIAIGQIIENYPDHRRGSCCLLTLWTNQQGAPLACGLYDGTTPISNYNSICTYSA